MFFNRINIRNTRNLLKKYLVFIGKCIKPIFILNLNPSLEKFPLKKALDLEYLSLDLKSGLLLSGFNLKVPGPSPA